MGKLPRILFHQEILKNDCDFQEILLQQLQVGVSHNFGANVMQVAETAQMKQHGIRIGIQDHVPVVDNDRQALPVRRHPRLITKTVHRVKHLVMHFFRHIRVIVQCTRYRRRRHSGELCDCRNIIFLARHKPLVIYFSQNNLLYEIFFILILYGFFSFCQ